MIPSSLCNEKLFTQFFRQYYPALCFFANRITGNAEAGKDIASWAFVKTWAKQGQLPTEGQLKAYLYQVARNDCYKWLQQHKKQTALLQELSCVNIPSEQSHLHAMIHAEVLSQLHSAINTLPPARREVFTRLYIEGKSVSETAIELHLSPSTIKTQKARGIAALKSRLAL